MDQLQGELKLFSSSSSSSVTEIVLVIYLSLCPKYNAALYSNSMWEVIFTRLQDVTGKTSNL